MDPKERIYTVCYVQVNGEQTKVLVIDQDPHLQAVLTGALAREGFTIESLATVPAYLDIIDPRPPALVVLDVSTARGGAARLCSQLRALATVPVIALGIGSQEEELIAVLDAGADSFRLKPVRPREFVARVRAMLRRRPLELDRELSLEIPDNEIRLDLEGQRVWIGERMVTLSQKEMQLLALLMTHIGRTVERRMLEERVWASNYTTSSRTLDSHVKRLRQKLEQEGGASRRIVTVRGVGFRYELPTAS